MLDVILMARGFTAATLEADSVAKGGAEKQAALVAATKELERTFKKTDFKQMKVIFNHLDSDRVDVLIALTSVLFDSFGRFQKVVNKVLDGCSIIGVWRTTMLLVFTFGLIDSQSPTRLETLSVLREYRWLGSLI